MPKKKHAIAIVEDDPMLLKYISAAFTAEGSFEVFTATDGEEGERIVRENKPDLVLLDIIMPKKNGFEVLEALKKDSATKDIPVLVLSNLGQEKDVAQTKKLGALDFLVKVDLEVEQIVKKVKDILKA